MGLIIGIVGLPNSGKSTVFNALTRTRNARVANFPFSTVEPNRAIISVPDARLDELHKALGVERKIYATLEIVDIAGLVKGASEGEGLGNQFLGQIRNVDAILHIVRCFDDPNVARVADSLDPGGDIEIVLTELILADLQQLEKLIEKLSSQIKGDKKLIPLMDTAEQMQAHLQGGGPLNSFTDRGSEHFQVLNRESRFLTAKPTIYVANVDESSLETDGDCAGTVRKLAAEKRAWFVKIGALFESELVDMSGEERFEFLALAGISESGLDQVVRTGYEALGLISFFTTNDLEVRAWTIPRGWGASQAAGAIHSDFERGFIRAEVIPFEVFSRHGSLGSVKQAGEMQIEGRDYLVRDGDILYIRFHI